MARHRRIAGFNGSGDHFVLVLNLSCEIGTSCFIGAGDPCSATQKLAQVLQGADQERVSRGLGDGTVKLDVFVHAVAAG